METVEVYKAENLREIDDGKKDYIINLPKGGAIVIEESAFVGLGYSYEQMKSNLNLVGAILADIGLKILAGNQDGND